MKKHTLAATLALAAAPAGCSGPPSAPETVSATAAAVTLGPVVGLTEIDGTYGASCLQRSGGWSLGLNGTNPPYDNPALTVIRGNTPCTLQVTGVHDSTRDYLAASPLGPLGRSFQASPVGFAATGHSLDFYGNAQQSDTAYAGNFALVFLYSDNPATGAADNNVANDAVVSATATASNVPSPDYVLSDGIAVVTDANNVVLTATGAITLTVGSVAAQLYAIAPGVVSGTFPADDAAWNAAAHAAAGATVSVAASSLLSPGDQLPVAKTILLQNALDGVPAYQSFQVSFLIDPPTVGVMPTSVSCSDPTTFSTSQLTYTIANFQACAQVTWAAGAHAGTTTPPVCVPCQLVHNGGEQCLVTNAYDATHNWITGYDPDLNVLHTATTNSPATTPDTTTCVAH